MTLLLGQFHKFRHQAAEFFPLDHLAIEQRIHQAIHQGTVFPNDLARLGIACHRNFAYLSVNLGGDRLGIIMLLLPAAPQKHLIIGIFEGQQPQLRHPVAGHHFPRQI